MGPHPPDSVCDLIRADLISLFLLEVSGRSYPGRGWHLDTVTGLGVWKPTVPQTTCAMASSVAGAGV